MQRYYITPMLDENLLVYDEADTDEEYFYVHDGLGTVRQILDDTQNVENQYDYEGFGTSLNSIESIYNRFRYTGREIDTETNSVNSTALYYYRARTYDSSAGSFTSRDPLSALNQYSYCAANPIIYTDPFGLAKCEKLGPDEEAALKKLKTNMQEKINKIEKLLNEIGVVYDAWDEYKRVSNGTSVSQGHKVDFPPKLGLDWQGYLDWRWRNNKDNGLSLAIKDFDTDSDMWKFMKTIAWFHKEMSKIINNLNRAFQKKKGAAVCFVKCDDDWWKKYGDAAGAYHEYTLENGEKCRNIYFRMSDIDNMMNKGNTTELEATLAHEIFHRFSTKDSVFDQEIVANLISYLYTSLITNNAQDFCDGNYPRKSTNGYSGLTNNLSRILKFYKEDESIKTGKVTDKEVTKKERFARISKFIQNNVFR